MVSRALAVVLAIGSGAGRAAAQDARYPPPVRRNRIGFDLGWASSVGELGLTYQFAVTPWARLEAGLGLGYSGKQLELMPKVAFGDGTCAFVAGFGPALALGGPVAESGPGHQPQPGVITWLNLDVPGLECRSEAGFSFEATLGLTMVLTDFHYDFADVGDTIHSGELFPQGRFGLGWWF